MPSRTAGTSPSSSATVSGAAGSALANLQKAYHSKEDISFWSALYSQLPIHTRQDYGSSSDAVSAAPIVPSSQDTGKCHRPIKIWQVLTKTVLPDMDTGTTTDMDMSGNLLRQPMPRQDPRQQPPFHFERLPIKVQTSASSLSPDGRPFSIVFFFTVESTPTTLWYLDSAFTQSSTLHEHMELMGTFQPNDPNDPMPFYVYETHTFSIAQPVHEDTMLDIRVQSPSGTIYAEFSYTFINESRHESSSRASSAPHSPRISTGHPANSRSSAFSGHQPFKASSGHQPFKTFSGYSPSKAFSGHLPSKALNGHSPPKALNGHSPSKALNGHSPSKALNGYQQHKDRHGFHTGFSKSFTVGRL
ncbi:MAG: hypothetical protein J3Q66DRAFT_373037 [Benniella sp.]|nr:MAG: hypothetical protein J3Q66DRAFT_373037 [Benniella sp.]